jgi:ATP-dependent Lhr-like helicase
VATSLRSSPIALLDRRNAALWMALAPQADASLASPRARAAFDRLAAQGALFFDELAEAAHLLRPEAEQALAELAALGLASSDSFAGLRALLVPSSQRQPLGGVRRRGRVLPFGMEAGGRWGLVRRARLDPADEHAKAAVVEHVARTLLRRYGVVFFRLLGREASWLPPWRDMLRALRRLEARGEIRGGRFVAGFSGEQYALPEAVGLLRELRRKPLSDQWVSLSAADPLNLIGILTPGPRLAALTANRVVFRDGLAVATLSGGKTQFLAEFDEADRWRAEKRLIRSAARGSLAHLA